MPSRTPPDDPGRLTMSTRPARPARPRDRIADATPAAAPADLIASAMPGISRSSTRRVISGVRSPGVRPVPPVVTTTSYSPAMAARSAASTGSPSATTSGPSTMHPAPRSNSTSTGPDLSAYTPAEARFDTVMASARTAPATPAAVADDRGRGDRLDHVNQGQRGDRYRGQRLHLHPGTVRGARLGHDDDRVVLHLQ